MRRLTVILVILSLSLLLLAGVISETQGFQTDRTAVIASLQERSRYWKQCNGQVIIKSVLQNMGNSKTLVNKRIRVVHLDNMVKFEEADNLSHGREHAYCVGDSFGFVLERRGAGWVLTNQMSPDQLRDSRQMRIYSFLTIPTKYIEGYELDRLIETCTYENDSKGRTVFKSNTIPNELHDNSLPQYSSLTVVADKGHILSSSVIEHVKNGSITTNTTYTYGDTKNPLPISAKRVSTWDTTTNMSHTVEDVSYEYDYSVKPSREEFRLSYYGLPDLLGQVSSDNAGSGVPFYLYAALFGILCFATARLMRGIRRRRAQGIPKM